MNNYFNLPDNERRKYYRQEYYNNNRSVKEIAELLDTYPNKIRRDIKKLGLDLKSRGQIQSEILNRGRKQHPTLGTQRPKETREKIAISGTGVWTKERQKKASARAKHQWKIKSDAEKRQHISNANKKLRETSKIGSKLERYLHEEFLEKGIYSRLHQKQAIINENLEIDILLPEHQIAIEIDGITHQKAVWSREDFERRKNADQRKNGLLLQAGYKVIRVKYNNQLTLADMIFIREKLLNQIENKATIPNYQEIIYEQEK